MNKYECVKEVIERLDALCTNLEVSTIQYETISENHSAIVIRFRDKDT
jgi:hypothetical protein